MCGLAGIARAHGPAVSRDALSNMVFALRHRGPDGSGIFLDTQVGLGHTRLSIVDLAGGAQPLMNENGRLLVVYNGEVYNHVELRDELKRFGHTFRTHCDTEVLVHAYEQWGEAMLHRLNGQFAFALYNRYEGTLFLARDRFGVRPLYYSLQNGNLVFASEVKALFASGEVRAAPDYEGLDEVFTFWAARPPRTPFRNVLSLEPGCCATWRAGKLDIRRYYELDFAARPEKSEIALARLDTLMRNSVRLRMRADVPVGGYLSGGLDSSITCALAGAASPYALRTFSVAFDDPAFDESPFQNQAAQRLGSRHNVQRIGPADIARVFPDVIRHTETPLVRTAPAPLFLLSRLTRENGIKVVLTGEGADEVFLGYDLFKETSVRRFCLRQPQSAWRPRLFDRLYPYLQGNGRAGDFWRRSFLDAGSPDDALFSHMPRFLLTSRIKDFYSAEMRAAVGKFDALEELRSSLPPRFHKWSALDRADYLEFTTLLSPYLLSSQGDRMAMAHGVEGRFPFLDHNLVEFAARLPAQTKLRGLQEKDILRRWAANILPKDQATRPKQPYRAPDVPAFFGDSQPDYVRELLEPEALRAVGVFDPAPTAALVRRCQTGLATGFRESQALVAILSTQLWYNEFCRPNQLAAHRTMDAPAIIQPMELPAF